MRRSSTIVYILILAALAAFTYYVKNHPKAEDAAATAEPTTEVSYLFTALDGAPTRLHIESKDGNVVEMARNAEKGWEVILPLNASADQGAAEAASTQVSALRILERLPDITPEAVGLDAPAYKFTIEFSSGVQRNVEVGVVTPTESGYYVRDGNNGIVIVSKNALDALLALLLNPPYAVTETPPPAVLETVPVPNETATAQP